MEATQTQALQLVVDGEPHDQHLQATSHALTTSEITSQVRLIQEMMSAVMHDGEHYGRIPGCGPKPALLKAGAEKLCLTFRLAPTYEGIQPIILEDGHREYIITCHLTHHPTGILVGSGVGSCSTMEKKYRVRYGKNVTGYDLADVYNTVLKIGKKRALVDAVLTVTAASDLFTQDIEDLPAEVLGRPEQREPQRQQRTRREPNRTQRGRERAEIVDAVVVDEPDPDALTPDRVDKLAEHVAGMMPKRLFSAANIETVVARARKCRTEEDGAKLVALVTERIRVEREKEAQANGEAEYVAEDIGEPSDAADVGDVPAEEHEDHPGFKSEPAKPRKLVDKDQRKPRFWETVKADATRTGLSFPEGEEGFLEAMQVTVWAELDELKGDQREKALTVAGSKNYIIALNKRGFETQIRQGFEGATISEALAQKKQWYARIRAVFLGDTLGIDTPEVTSLAKLLDRCYADATAKAAPGDNPDRPRRTGPHDPPSDQRPTERRR